MSAMQKEEGRMMRFKHPSKWEEEFWADARANCDAAIKEFVECSKEHGMLVVIKCRSSNKAMNQCLSKYTTEELWEPFKAARVQERDALIASGAVVGMAGPVKEGEGK